jgi:hypothetical protein
MQVNKTLAESLAQIKWQIVEAIKFTNLLLLNLLQSEELEVRVIPSQENISEVAQLEKILRERHC